MGVDISHGGNAEAEKFVLRILRHDAGIAHAVKFDAPRMREHGNGVFQIGFFQRAACAQNRGGGVAEHFFHHTAHVVVGIELFMHIRHAFVADAGRQRKLEFGQAFIAQAAAEADNCRLAHRGMLGNFGHGRMHKPFGLGQRTFGHFTLCA